MHVYIQKFINNAKFMSGLGVNFLNEMIQNIIGTTVIVQVARVSHANIYNRHGIID